MEALKDAGRRLCFWLENVGIIHHHDWTGWKALNVRDASAGSFKCCRTCWKQKNSR